MAAYIADRGAPGRLKSSIFDVAEGLDKAIEAASEFSTSNESTSSNSSGSFILLVTISSDNKYGDYPGRLKFIEHQINAINPTGDTIILNRTQWITR